MIACTEEDFATSVCEIEPRIVLLIVNYKLFKTCDIFNVS